MVPLCVLIGRVTRTSAARKLHWEWLTNLNRDETSMLRACLLLAFACLCAGLWLLLLEFTDFSNISVSAGLLGVLTLSTRIR
jgi:hypothetical protein